MSVAVVTGSAGLIGSEAVVFLARRGFDVVGIDNDMRAYFFGPEASTARTRARLEASLPSYHHESVDIRDEAAIDRIFSRFGRDIEVVVHTAAQPSHDWATREPMTDFSINATGTLVLLEATRRHAPDAVFSFLSTNKVYGDTPNTLPLVEHATRWEVESSHPFAARGIDESMSVDRSKHSLFGSSKVAADVVTQEYGRTFGIRTGVFRGGCLTGPAHVGVQLHGFLAYLMRCAVEGRPYTIFGYQGKQVRDNIHAHDLVSAIWEFICAPRPGEVYNIGGGRSNSCSVLEAIHACEELAGRKLAFTLTNESRSGDHIWWISDVGKFREHFPAWKQQYDLHDTLAEIRDALTQKHPHLLISATSGE